jgi:hypothetical protein
MTKLILRVIGEILFGFFLAGIVLAVSVPMLMRSGMIVPGDIASVCIIAGTLALVVGAMLFRPGSALHRRGQ